MKTVHQIIFKNSQKMSGVPSESVDLIVTSPPYPMIEMWDEIFSKQNKKIHQALSNRQSSSAFELMHQELDLVWDEVYRVLTKGGIACINIGDATRTINDHFALYTNHARIQTYMQNLGFSALPAILWRKQTNAPNKFMGSGMMPPGAYVTLEHEYILILRKGNKKEFSTDSEKQNRRESAFFWEERNIWFSDVWMDLKGTTQNLFDDKVRNRSASFPFELAYRLINMFSVKGDRVLDPFLGIGTTMFAAMAACRNSTGYEIEPNLTDLIRSRVNGIVEFSNHRITQRLENHLNFIEEYFQRKGKFKYLNQHYGFPVVTGQEKELLFNPLFEIRENQEKHGNSFEVSYLEKHRQETNGNMGNWNDYTISKSEQTKTKKAAALKKTRQGKQRLLFEK
ncbi:MAG: site-specific DNA-methyltransferase [Desulfobacterales bacterium]|nr:site-specific DNA-methyltransferase [Desulfobacterales bacterium]